MFPGSDIEQIEVRRMDEAMTETIVERNEGSERIDTVKLIQ